jgi:hypothetical protein
MARRSGASARTTCSPASTGGRWSPSPPEAEASDLLEPRPEGRRPGSRPSQAARGRVEGGFARPKFPLLHRRLAARCGLPVHRRLDRRRVRPAPAGIFGAGKGLSKPSRSTSVRLERAREQAQKVPATSTYTRGGERN